MGKKKTGSRGLRKNDLERIVIDFFQENPSIVFSLKTLCKQLHLNTNPAKMLLMDVLENLLMDDFIKEQPRFCYTLNMPKQVMSGIFHRKANGKNTFEPEDGGEPILVAERNSLHAMDGDTVQVTLLARRKYHVREAAVTEILKRSDKTFVGTLQVQKGYAYLLTEDRTLANDIFIPKEHLKKGKTGDKAVVRIVEWPDKAKNPIGKVVDILGKTGENTAEMHAILAEYGLPYTYPALVEKAAEKLTPGITEEEISRRLDMRDVLTFTIDPADAKDFDDALSIREIKKGLWEVGVHIADVSHYVTEGSIIDKEAYKRATSVYLVDRTVPMLPERLCNYICSLRPDEDKLTYSVIFHMNEKAEVKNWKLAHTVTRSDRRFTYEEVQQIFEERGEASPEDYKEQGARSKGQENTSYPNNSPAPCPLPLAPEMGNSLIILNRLAKILRQKRFAAGAVDFDRCEVRFNIDKDGHPTGVYFKVAKDANKLIEEFMLLANRTVAESIGKVPKNQKPKVLPYRIHENPDPEKLLNLADFVKKFGHKLKTTGNRSDISRNLNRLLEDVKGKREQNVIEMITLRAMMKATHPPLPRPHGAPPADTLCRGRTKRQPAQVRRVLRALQRHGADRSPGRTRQHQIQAGGVHERPPRRDLPGHHLRRHGVRPLRRDRREQVRRHDTLARPGGRLLRLRREELLSERPPLPPLLQPRRQRQGAGQPCRPLPQTARLQAHSARLTTSIWKKALGLRT